MSGFTAEVEELRGFSLILLFWKSKAELYVSSLSASVRTEHHQVVHHLRSRAGEVPGHVQGFLQRLHQSVPWLCQWRLAGRLRSEDRGWLSVGKHKYLIRWNLFMKLIKLVGRLCCHEESWFGKDFAKLGRFLWNYEFFNLKKTKKKTIKTFKLANVSGVTHGLIMNSQPAEGLFHWGSIPPDY